MFSAPRVNVIESDSGFSIKVLGRTGLEYREGDKTISIYSEVLISEAPSIAIWKSSIRGWNPPHDLEQLSESRREVIVDNIRAALEWSRARLEVIP
jgi:hypothetical protein